MTEPVNVADYERLAEDALEPGPLAYVSGGAADERTLRDNVAAFGRRWLRPRMLVDVGEARTETTVLGTPVSMPILVAPTAFQRMAHPDGELATARAAAAAGTIMCLSTIATSSAAEVAEAAPEGRRWFQLYCYRDRGVTRSLVEQAVTAGYEAVVLTVDVPVFGRRERDVRLAYLPTVTVPSAILAFGRSDPMSPAEIATLFDPTLSWRDLEWIASLSNLPLLVKGVLTHEDAELAVEHGAAGVVVSNHGGRQLDGVQASIDALPEVVEAVDGRCEVLVDGGIRRGGDVCIALALGARAVLVGRPILWGLAVGGADGAARVLELLRTEFLLALRLLGCTSPDGVTRAHVGP